MKVIILICFFNLLEHAHLKFLPVDASKKFVSIQDFINRKKAITNNTLPLATPPNHQAKPLARNSTLSPADLLRWKDNERIKQARIFAIQRDIYSQLNFFQIQNTTYPPNLTDTNIEQIKHKMRKCFEVDRWEKDSFKRCWNVSPSCASLKILSNSNISYRLHFDLKHINEDLLHSMKVAKATIRFRRKISEKEKKILKRLKKMYKNKKSLEAMFIKKPQHMINVTMFAFVRNRNHEGPKGVSRKMIKSVSVPRLSEGWLQLGLRGVAQEWLKHPRRNLGIFLEVRNHQSKLLDPHLLFHDKNCKNKGKAQRNSKLKIKFENDDFAPNLNIAVINEED